MQLPLIIAAIVMFVFCFLIKKFLHVFGLPLIILVGSVGFILLMVGLFKSGFTNVQQPQPPCIQDEEKQQ